jgi:prevent-host-death family protein
MSRYCTVISAKICTNWLFFDEKLHKLCIYTYLLWNLSFVSLSPVMKLNSDAIEPFYAFRQNLSRHVDAAEQRGMQVVVTRHGSPVAALISSAALSRYQELESLMKQLVLSFPKECNLASNLTADAENKEVIQRAKSLLNAEVKNSLRIE